MFRVGFIFDYFTTEAFLCDSADSTPSGTPITCSGANNDDSASHVGGFFSLSATPLSFLEAYASLRIAPEVVGRGFSLDGIVVEIVDVQASVDDVVVAYK